MWGELAALTTAVCWSFTAIFFSHSGRRIGSGVVNRSRLIFALLFLTVSHWVVEGVPFPVGAEPFRWGWLAVSSVLGLVVGDTFLFYAYVLIGPRLSMLLMSTVPIYGAISGWILFGERITAVETAGILLAVAGIAWVVTEKRPGMTVVENKEYKRGLLMAALGALGQVANLVTARYALVDNFSSLSATVIRIFVALIVLWLLAALRGQIGHTLRQWKDRTAFASLIGGSFVGPFLGIWFSLIAIQLARLGIASTLMALPPVLLIPIEYVLYRRRVSGRAIAGTVISFVGVALLFGIVGG
jgi:drug/metabolite transporter (DMT)-like permease